MVRRGTGFARVLALGFAALLIGCPTEALAANLASGFDSDAEGWTVAQNGASDGPPTYSAAGGNPGGFVSAIDAASDSSPPPQVWQLVSPDSWDGNLLADYGGTVSYDVNHPAGATLAPTVTIVGPSNHTLTSGNPLVGPGPPADTWTRYSFLISPDDPHGWRYSLDAEGSGSRPAKAADFSEVLSGVQVIYVLGDLKFGSMGEKTEIDNIVMSEPAQPVDSDGDGVPDADDKCPSEAGPAANGGCPESPDPGPGPGPGPVGDTQAPVISLFAKKHEPADGTIEVSVSCDEACAETGTGTLTVKAPKARKSAAKSKQFELRPDTDSSAAGATATLGLRLTHKAKKAALAALRDGGHARAALTITAADAAGNSATANRGIRLKAE